MRVDASESKVNILGRLGENEATVVWFPIRSILYEFPDATFVLLNKRVKDPAAYPVVVEKDGVYLKWTVTSGDLAYVGDGECEINAYQGSAIVKTVIYKTRVLHALDGSGTPPDPWKSWQQAVAEDADRAEAAADRAETAVAHSPMVVEGIWYVWNADEEEYVSTGIPAQGETGATPDFAIGTVTTGAAGSSASASITGTAEAPVLNMTIPRGDKGEKGDSVLVGTLISGDDYMLESEVAE